MPRKLFDAGVMAAYLLLALLCVISDNGRSAVLPVIAALTIGASGLASWSRRERPLRFYVVSMLAAASLALTTTMLFWAFLIPLPLFCLAAYERRENLQRRLIIATLASTALVLFLITPYLLIDALIMVMLISVAGWGRGEGARLAYTESLEQRALAAERERDIRAAQAVAEERSRIARDIHDLVSHSLAVVAVQAAGAERIADRNPERAKEALGVIASTSREALSEMRAMLQVLRSGGESATEAPSPGLPDLDRLVGDLRAGGMSLDMTTTGEPYALGPGAELALFRVAQESLTNAVKHGSGNRASLHLDYGPKEFLVEVTNPVSAPSASHDHQDQHPHAELPGGGTGQTGMRERLALYGGSLTTEESAGTYRVTARVPRDHQRDEPEMNPR